MTLRSSNLQSDSDLDSIRNSCDVFSYESEVFVVLQMASSESQNQMGDSIPDRGRLDCNKDMGV